MKPENAAVAKKIAPIEPEPPPGRPQVLGSHKIQALHESKLELRQFCHERIVPAAGGRWPSTLHHITPRHGIGHSGRNGMLYAGRCNGRLTSFTLASEVA